MNPVNVGLQIPEALQKELNAAAKSVAREPNAPKIFCAFPNMVYLNAALVSRMFQWATDEKYRKYEPWFQLLTEKRHADHSRNLLAQAFLKSNCDYLMMIDHDVCPPPELLTLADKGKDIISANVFCWIDGELIPSIWEQAECEQCRNLKIYREEGKIHDAREYRESEEKLYRWNPFQSVWMEFATREGGIKEGSACRCRGTGKDPFVFKMDHNIIGAAPLLKVNSVGSAAMMIHRRVFEKMPFPWFTFLYREDRSIMLTEDHYFCWKAGECGFEIWAEPTMGCSHYKLIDLLEVNTLINRAYQLGIEKGTASGSIMIPEPVSA